MRTNGDDLLARLRCFAQARDRFKAAAARRAGISGTELDALETLGASRQPLTPSELGHRVALSSGAVTALVDRLERAGLLARRPHPHDRRSVLLELTAAAGAAEHQALRPLVDDLRAATAGMDAEERLVVARFLDAVTEVTARHADGHAPARNGAARQLSSAASSSGSVTGVRQAKRSHT